MIVFPVQKALFIGIEHLWNADAWYQGTAPGLIAAAIAMLLMAAVSVCQGSPTDFRKRSVLEEVDATGMR